jgi:hypothetical protein
MMEWGLFRDHHNDIVGGVEQLHQVWGGRRGHDLESTELLPFAEMVSNGGDGREDLKLFIIIGRDGRRWRRDRRKEEFYIMWTCRWGKLWIHHRGNNCGV